MRDRIKAQDPNFYSFYFLLLIVLKFVDILLLRGVLDGLLANKAKNQKVMEICQVTFVMHFYFLICYGLFRVLHMLFAKFRSFLSLIELLF